jgi:hypothetical protein
MRKIWHGHVLALLLAGLLTCPAVTLAESITCFHAAHHCAPVPESPVTPCCIPAANTEQPSLTVDVVAYELTAARGPAGDHIATVAGVVAPARSEPGSCVPINRLSLFGQLLI